MQKNNVYRLTLFSISVLFALILQHFPILQGGIHVNWLLLVVIYWQLADKNIMDPILAFLLGITLDLLTGSLLGLQGFTFATTALIASMLKPLLVKSPLLTRITFAFGIVITYWLINYWMIHIIYHRYTNEFLLPLIVNIFCMGLLYLIIDRADSYSQKLWRSRV